MEMGEESGGSRMPYRMLVVLLLYDMGGIWGYWADLYAYRRHQGDSKENIGVYN
jgi:hypothetical protein